MGSYFCRILRDRVTGKSCKLVAMKMGFCFVLSPQGLEYGEQYLRGRLGLGT
jgi:hypothetical protein